MIVAFGTAIVGPILSWLKSETARKTLAREHDARVEVLENRVKVLEDNTAEIKEIKGMVHSIQMAVSKFEVMADFFCEHMKKEAK